MGFTLKIGEHKPEKNIEEDGEVWIYNDAEEVRLDNAPADGSPTDYTNQRWPSYSGWYDFMEDTKLKSLFEGDKSLMPDHPGVATLTIEHKKIIDKTFEKKDQFKDYNQNRIEWLKFWVDWALENCSNPVFVNS